MNKLQSRDEATTLDHVSDRIPPAPIACPEAVPPNAADLLEGLSDAIYTLDEQWCFTYMNARAETLMQRPRTELLGRNIWQECPEAAESAFHREFEQTMAGKEAVAFEAYSLCADAWLSVRVSPLPSGLSVLLQDITERKVAEAERQERASLVEASFDAIISTTLEGIITSWNPSATKLYGYTEQEAVGKHISLIIPPERDAELPPIMAQLRRGERIEAFETVRRNKNGTDVHVSLTISPIRDTHGKIVGASNVVRDITEQKRVAGVSLAREARLNGILFSAMDAIVTVDEGQRVLFFNAAAERMFGCSASDAVGRLLSDFLPERFRARHAQNVIDFGITGVTARTLKSLSPLVGLRFDGEEFPIEATISQIEVQGQKIYTAILRDVSERKRNEHLLQQMTEGANCLIWQADVEETGKEWLQWKAQFASEQAAQRLLPLHLTAGQSYRDAWRLARHVEDREHSDRYGTQEIRAGRSYQQEFRCHSKDGALRWLSENVSVEAVGEDKWRCTGVCTDITERKVAEEATRALTRGAQCLLWYALVEERSGRLHWDVEMADEEAAQQFFPVVQPPGMSYNHASANARLPEDNAVMEARAGEALRSGKQGYTNQFRCRRADGEWRWVNETVHVETLAPGRWRCVGVNTDITEQKQVEEERDRFFTLSLELLCVIDFNGYFTRMNPAFETVLGYTRAELMAKPFLDFVHPDDRDATIAETRQLNAGERTLHFENRYLCRDGSIRWLAWTSIAFQGFRYAAAHDITPVKEAEIALRKANEDLEARVEERTIQIMEANAQLLTAKNEADRANLAKSEFLSRMSHELRTPLNSVLGFGQILDKEALTPFQQESIGYILKGGRHLLDLINEVLDLARIEAGHIALSLEAVALLEDTQEACDLVRPLAVESGILLTLDAASFGRSYIQADRQRLKQVLINLLSNAIKYNFKGGQVRIYGVHGSNDRCCIAIQDTGWGLTLEEQQRLFSPFERLNAAHSGIEGTGLGLVLTHRLVTAMGGSLTLQSLPGKGTTFFVELPLVPSPVEALATLAIGGGEPQTDLSEKSNATILYIEDNLSNMRLLEVLLRSRPGITLLPAMQGSVGLDLARQHEPDLILLDLHLPDISGTEVLARLQRSALTRDIPVVILNADATASQIERRLHAGARAYLTKPLDITEFLHTLDTLLPVMQADGSPDVEVTT